MTKHDPGDDLRSRSPAHFTPPHRIAVQNTVDIFSATGTVVTAERKNDDKGDGQRAIGGNFNLVSELQWLNARDCTARVATRSVSWGSHAARRGSIVPN